MDTIKNPNQTYFDSLVGLCNTFVASDTFCLIKEIYITNGQMKKWRCQRKKKKKGNKKEKVKPFILKLQHNFTDSPIEDNV